MHHLVRPEIPIAYLRGKRVEGDGGAGNVQRHVKQIGHVHPYIVDVEGLWCRHALLVRPTDFVGFFVHDRRR